MLFKIEGDEKYTPESDQKAFSHSTSAASPLLPCPFPFPWVLITVQPLDTYVKML